MKSILVAVLLIVPFTKTGIEPQPVLSPREYIVKYAEVYKAPEKELIMVSKCESNFNPNAIGDGGKAKNIFQYHEPTFNRYEKLLGEELDYNSYHDQARLTAFIFANYPKEKKAWSCFTRINKVK